MKNLLRALLPLATLAGAGVVLATRVAGPRALWPALALALVVVLAVVVCAGRLLLWLYRAHPADDTTAPGVVRLVRELAVAAGMPAPRVWIVDEHAPAAFATGLVPQRAAIALTTGLLSLLPERELRAVLAHELAHIRRRDTRAASLCVAVAGAVPLLGLLGLDRTREFEADRDAAHLCGDPAALASALARIERTVQRIPVRAAERHPHTAALLIVDPGEARGWHRWLGAQPSAAGRIQRLRALAQGEHRPQV